jgi:hypothetical protein
MYSIWSSEFLKSKDLQKVKVGSRLSVMTNTELGLFPLSQKTSEFIQWMSGDLDIARVRY